MSFTDLLLGDAQSVARTLVVGLAAYAALLVLLRTSGTRTLAKMNAFDFVVTIALGSTLATILTSDTVGLAHGLAALAFLVGVQFAVSWSSVRVRRLRAILTGEPVLLLRRGVFLPHALRSARITEAEVRAAVRGAGVAALEEVEAVVLETDGSCSVIRRGGHPALSSLAGVRPGG